MMSNRAVNLAYTFANDRAMYYLKSAYKILRTELLEEGMQNKYINTMQQAILSAMITSYIYGRLAVAAQTKVIDKLENTKKFIDDWSMPVDVIQIILKYDKELLQTIFGRKTKMLYDKKDAFAEYFRPSETALQFMKNYSFELALLQGRNIEKEAKAIIQNTVSQGLDMRKTSRAIASKLKDISMFRARAIAQTETTRCYNLGTVKEAQESEIVKGYVFNAVLDLRTTDICAARNGKFIPKEEIQLIAENTPPLHVNCRSRLEIVTEFDSKEYPKLVSSELPDSMQRESDIIAVLNNTPRAPEKIDVGSVPVEEAKPKSDKETITLKNGKTYDLYTGTDMSPETKQALAEAEASIKPTRKTEKAFAFGKDGTVLIEQDGEESNVSIPFQYSLASKGEYVMLTHNHPGDYTVPFSKGDVLLANENNVRIVRAFGNTDVYELEFKRRLTTTEGRNFVKLCDAKRAEEFDKLTAEYDAKRAAAKNWDEKIKLKHEKNYEAQNRAWTVLAEEFKDALVFRRWSK